MTLATEPTAVQTGDPGDLLHVVDLEAVDPAEPITVRHAAVTVGVARGPLTERARAVARELALSVGPVDDGVEVVGVSDIDEELRRLATRVGETPHAGLTCVQVLRLTAQLESEDALVAESLAYSALLAGDEFRRWRAATPVRDGTPSVGAVALERQGNVLRITLDRPARRNSLDAAARGALSDALDVGLADPGLAIELRGAGAAFCSGGDLDEFGTATDLALAHQLRIQRGPALRMLRTGPRTTAFVHGAVVGAGVELSAFADRVVAAPQTTFRLPEVSMGLIPGAGGTVSVTGRVGRWKAGWMMLTGATLGVARAHAWGLVDDVR